MNKGDKTGTWKIDLEANTVVLTTNEGLNRASTGEKDWKEGDLRGLGQACSQHTAAGWLWVLVSPLREGGP